jgi:hypothetical protein
VSSLGGVTVVTFFLCLRLFPVRVGAQQFVDAKVVALAAGEHSSRRCTCFLICRSVYPKPPKLKCLSACLSVCLSCTLPPLFLPQARTTVQLGQMTGEFGLGATGVQD